jgi:hypothetical protein
MPPVTTMYQQPESQRPGPLDPQALVRYGLLAVGIIALSITGLTLMRAVQVRQATGLVTIEPSDKYAVVSIGQSGALPQQIGAGEQTVRLRPGTYQITAANASQGATKQVTVSKQKTATVSLQTTKTVPVSTVAKYNATSLYAPDNESLYFLNTDEDMPYVYSRTARTAKPYLANVNNNAALHWISPTQVISESPEGVWTYVTGSDNAIALAFDDVFTPAGNIGVNAAGQIAFVTDRKQVVVSRTPGDDPIEIGSVSNAASEASIATDGTIITYTPSAYVTAAADTLTVYGSDNTVQSSTDLGYVNAVSWSPDSHTFSYATTAGIFTYDISTKAKRQIVANTPSNPASTFWISNTKLLYADQGSVWSYDTVARSATKLATVEGILAPHPFVSAPNGVVSFSTSKDSSGKGGAIYSFAPNYYSLSPGERQALDTTAADTAQQPTTYSGFDELEDYATDEQVEILKYSLASFVISQNEHAATMQASDAQYMPGGNSRSAITFRLRIDNAQYQARMELSGITTIRVQLTNANGQLVYDSGDASSL